MNIPKGYKLVPVKANCDQLHAGASKSGVLVIYEAMVEAAPAVEFNAYDEAKEREMFELNYEVPDGVYFSKEKNEYRSMNMLGFEILACEELTPKFKGWIACAKSRARSAE